MGNCLGGPPISEEEKREKKMNDKIAAQNKKDFQEEQRKIKLLLLGTGESGKSTIVKQVKKLYGNGISEEERHEWTPRVYENINKQVLALIAGGETLGIQLNEELVAPFKNNFKATTVIDEKLAEDIRAFWNDKATQDVWDKRAEYQILDCIEYYVENLDRIAKSNYVADFQDIIQARVRTSGIVTEHFKMEGIPFELYDVGGQRSERKKWINCFDNVTSVIFVAAINEYDQKLFEDSTTDRIEEALTVFEQVVNNPIFKDISFVVFLNKFDLFKKKLFQYPYRVAEGKNSRNVDFKGPYAEDIVDNDPVKMEECIEAAALHTQQKFEAMANEREGLGALTYHHTNATDSRNMSLVFNACKDQILRVNLHRSGFSSGA